jgi:hypothetical protein
MAADKELPFNQKRFLVQQLACFETPTSAAALFKVEFGFEIKPNRVAYYNAHTKSAAALAPELVTLFDETRKQFLEKLEDVAIYHKAVQLRVLERALALAVNRGQIPMVIALVEAAAKIAGTITTKVDVKHSGKVTTEVVDAARQRVFDRLDDLRQRIAGRVDGLAAASGASRAPEGAG